MTNKSSPVAEVGSSSAIALAFFCCSLSLLDIRGKVVVVLALMALVEVTTLVGITQLS